MKKALSLILAVILLFSVLPMTAYAVEAEELAETGNQISTVSVTVTKPHSGENPVYSATVPSGEGYMVKNYNQSIDGYKNGVQWYSYDDKKYLDESDSFEVGKEYLVTVLLIPTEEGDTFDNNVTGTMNNGNAIIRFNTKKSIIYISRFFTCTEEIIIDYVNVNGVTEPKPSAHPVYSATVPSGEGYMVKDFSDAVNKNGISWENATDHKYMSESDTFEEGKNYTIQICLEPISDSFVFSSRAVGTVNGETAAIDRNLNSFITLLYTFTCNDPFIRNVSVSGITEPVAGAYPDGKFTLPDNCGYTLENSWSGSVKWYTEDGDILDPQADKFQAGERYNAQVTVLASDGYAFADKGLTGTMNGKDVTGSIFTVNATKIYMSRWFTCSDPMIKKVSVTGITKPVAGNSPSYSAVVSGGNGYQISNTNNTFTKNGIAWFNMTDSTFLFPANNDQFAAGKQYGAFITLVTASNDFQFADEPSATVNGKPATISAKGKSSITVFYVFNGSYLLGDADDNGEIESVDATLVQRNAAGMYTPFITQVLMQADVDRDGSLTVLDASNIQRYLCQLKTDYAIGTVVS